MYQGPDNHTKQLEDASMQLFARVRILNDSHGLRKTLFGMLAG